MTSLAASATATIPGVVFTSLSVAATASVGGTYIPPFAGTNTRDAGAAATTAIYNNPNPTTPAFLEDFDWIESYLAIHVTSAASYRYAYIMWILIAIAVAVTAAMHLTGNRGGALGARWAKWAMRRRTWRKKKVRPAAKPGGRPGAPFVFPSNAQVVSMVLLFAIPLLLCVLGPDYIAPGTKVFDLTHNLSRRALLEDFNEFATNLDFFLRRDVPVASTPTTRPPDFTIQKTWWTFANRAGDMAYALFPLVVIFALKAPPFALLAIPFTVQIHFDKLARLHRWTGRLIWFVTTIHVIAWLIQLAGDKRHGHPGAVALNYAFLHTKFVFGFLVSRRVSLLFGCGSLIRRSRRDTYSSRSSRCSLWDLCAASTTRHSTLAMSYSSPFRSSSPDSTIRRSGVGASRHWHYGSQRGHTEYSTSSTVTASSSRTLVVNEGSRWQRTSETST